MFKMSGSVTFVTVAAVFAFITSPVIVTVECLRMDPEVHMNTSQLITSKGYPCEEYDVHTSDGYILGIQRIPRGRNSTRDELRPVVLLQHGLLSCSAAWVENLVNESFAFLLADAGFDVWLANNRGNTYARRHEKLNPNQKEFWDFSWDEMGKYDLPATINKILNITKASQLFYVGYSQGGMFGFSQLSVDPELNSKIKLFAALAPSVYLSNTKSPLKLFAPFSKELPVINELLGHGEFLKHTKFLTWLSSESCSHGNISKQFCGNLLFVMCGYDTKYLNESRFPVYVGQNPAGTSVRTMVHYAQTIADKNFAMYDYGTKENKIKYNQTTPPEYDVTKVTVPVVLYTGHNDTLVDATDVNILKSKIQNLVHSKVVPDWEHLDFIWAMNGPQAMYNEIITLFKSYDDNNSSFD